jgi:hypothetical protein
MTLFSMPLLDLGDKPVTYNVKASESEQIYVIPRSKYPNSIVIPFHDCKPTFQLH